MDKEKQNKKNDLEKETLKKDQNNRSEIIRESRANYTVVEFRKKSQVTIPRDIVKKYNLNEGDKLEFIPEGDGFKVRPVTVVPKSQMWFWSDKWQKGEKKADSDIKAGRVSKEYDDFDELIQDLFDDDYEV